MECARAVVTRMGERRHSVSVCSCLTCIPETGQTANNVLNEDGLRTVIGQAQRENVERMTRKL